LLTRKGTADLFQKLQKKERTILSVKKWKQFLNCLQILPAAAPYPMAELGSCFNRHAKRGEHDNGTRNLIDICNPKFRNKVQDLDKPGTSGRKKQPLPPFLPDSIGLNRPTSPQYLLTEGS
jgi:hypothetical protein